MNGRGNTRNRDRNPLSGSCTEPLSMGVAGGVDDVHDISELLHVRYL